MSSFNFLTVVGMILLSSSVGMTEGFVPATITGINMNTQLCSTNTEATESPAWWKASRTAKAQFSNDDGGEAGARGGTASQQLPQQGQDPPSSQPGAGGRRLFSKEERDLLMQDISGDDNDKLIRHNLNRPGQNPTPDGSLGRPVKTAPNTPWARSNSFPRTGTSITDPPREDIYQTNRDGYSRQAHFEAPTTVQQEMTSAQQQFYSPEDSSLPYHRHPSAVSVARDEDGRGFHQAYNDPPPTPSKAPWDAYHSDVGVPSASSSPQRSRQQMHVGRGGIGSTAPSSNNNVGGQFDGNSDNILSSLSSSSGLVSEDEFVRSLLNTEDDDDDDDRDEQKEKSPTTGYNPMGGYNPGSSSSTPGGGRSTNPMSTYTPGSNTGFSGTPSTPGATSSTSFGASNGRGYPPSSTTSPASSYNPGASYNPTSGGSTSYSAATGSVPGATNSTPSYPAGVGSSWSHGASRTSYSPTQSKPTTRTGNPASSYSPYSGSSSIYGSTGAPSCSGTAGSSGSSSATYDHPLDKYQQSSTATSSNPNLVKELQAEIHQLKKEMSSMAKQHANVMEKLLDVEDKLDQYDTVSSSMESSSPQRAKVAPTNTGTGRGSPPSTFFFGKNNNYSG